MTAGAAFWDRFADRYAARPIRDVAAYEAMLADAAARAKLGKPATWQARYIEDSATPLSQWFGGMLQSRAGVSLLQASGVGELVLARQLQAQAPLRFIDNALRNRGNVRVTPLAYCFCTLQ